MSIEAMKQALEALEGWDNYGDWVWPETALEQCKRSTKESLTALRQAIEEAEKQFNPDWDQQAVLVERIRELEAQLYGQAEKQEPVAWWNGKDGFKRADDVDSVPNWTDYYYIALYKDPTPCKTCEALARSVMMDQTSHDTAPQRKEWVGLTDDEIDDIAAESGFGYINVARAIEAKLREKNGGS